MRVAVYSGSFDPLHIGHLAIMRAVCGCGDFDALYLVVSPQNPLKDSLKAENADQRLRDAREAMARHPELNVKVDDIEFGMSAPHYTIRTLDALREREPDNEFTLVIGADNLELLHRWKDSERILHEYGVVVFPREACDSQATRRRMLEEDPQRRIKLIDAPLVNISSTQIRKGLSEGKDMSKYMI